jgi:hypothetical protein
MCVHCANYAPVICEHPRYGTLVVASMIDIDNETTDDIEMAMEAMCPLPNGDWLHLCVHELLQGTLMKVKRLH